MELPFTHMEFASVIAQALPSGRHQLGHPTPAECAAWAVLQHIEARERGEKTKHRRALRSDIADVLYDRFGPRYSLGYDGPRPIDERFFAAADEITVLVSHRVYPLPVQPHDEQAASTGPGKPHE